MPQNALEWENSFNVVDNLCELFIVSDQDDGEQKNYFVLLKSPIMRLRTISMNIIWYAPGNILLIELLRNVSIISLFNQKAYIQ